MSKQKLLLLLLLMLNSFGAKAWDDMKYWQPLPQYPIYRLVPDTTTTLPDVTRIETRGTRKGIIGVIYPMFCMGKDSAEIRAKIKYKAVDCQSLAIVMTTLGAGERVQSTKKVVLPITDEWTEMSCNVIVKDAYYLYVYIEAEGVNDEGPGKIYVAGIDVTSDGRKLERKTDCFQAKKINPADLVPLDKMMHLPIMDKKILALGETAHGTETLCGMAMSLMKERILNHGCKLIMMETSMMASLSMNRYIKNDERFKLSDISKDFNTSIFSDSIVSFLQWLKEYNSTHHNEVSMFGFDRGDIWATTSIPLDVFDFLYTLNTQRVASVDTICKKMLDTENKDVDLLPLLDNNHDLERLLTKEEMVLLRYCFSQMKKKPFIFRVAERDEKMAEIVELIAGLYLTPTTTATLYSHFLHSDYLSDSRTLSMICSTMGGLLKERYRKDYACIGLATCKGSACFINKENTGHEFLPLQSAPIGSLEYEIASKYDGAAFMPMDALNDSDIFMLRNSGAIHADDQFMYAVPKARMDGIIVVPSASPSKKTKAAFKKPNEIWFERYRTAMDKVKPK